MIRNRLAILFAERQLKISKVSSKTKISRTTLTSLAQNESKMVQMETVNTLCMFLRIPVEDFFEFIPYNFEYYIDISDSLKYDPKEAPLTYEIEAYINVQGENETFSLDYSGELVDYSSNMFEVDLNPVNKEEMQKAKDFFDSIPSGFTAQIKSDFEKYILNTLLGTHDRSPSFVVTVNLY